MNRLEELKAKQVAGTITANEMKELATLEAGSQEVTVKEISAAVSAAVGTAVRDAISSLTEAIKTMKAPAVVEKLGDKESFAEVLIGIKTGNKRIIDKYKMKTALEVFGQSPNAKVLAEGAGATGGFLVPVEQSNKIIDLITEKSIIRKMANVYPMSSMTATVPVAQTNLAAFWIAENAAKTPNDPVFNQMLLTAFELCCLTGVSDAFLADSDPRVDKILYNLFAMAMIRGEEVAFLQGTGAAPADPITGIYNWPGISTVAYSGDLMDDLADGIGAVDEHDGETISVLYAGREKRKIRKMKDDEGQYIFQKPAEKGFPATIWDADAYKDKYIPSNLGVGVNQSYAICGDFNYAHIGDNGGIVIDSSTHWQFDHNQTWFRAVRRVAFRLSDPTKFSRVTGITVL